MILFLMVLRCFSMAFYQYFYLLCACMYFVSYSSIYEAACCLSKCIQYLETAVYQCSQSRFWAKWSELIDTDTADLLTPEFQWQSYEIVMYWSVLWCVLYCGIVGNTKLLYQPTDLCTSTRLFSIHQYGPPNQSEAIRRKEIWYYYSMWHIINRKSDIRNACQMLCCFWLIFIVFQGHWSIMSIIRVLWFRNAENTDGIAESSHKNGIYWNLPNLR